MTRMSYYAHDSRMNICVIRMMPHCTPSIAIDIVMCWHVRHTPSIIQYIICTAADMTRVPLMKAVDNSDYINASLVPVANAYRRYICAQGPLAGTAAHFWQMVHEQHTGCIVMLAKCIERGQPKVPSPPTHRDSP